MGIKNSAESKIMVTVPPKETVPEANSRKTAIIPRAAPP